MIKSKLLITTFIGLSTVANAQFTDPSKGDLGQMLAGLRIEETFQFIRTTKADFELKSNQNDWIEETTYTANIRNGATSLVASFNSKNKIEALYYYTGEASAMMPWARFDYDEQGKLVNIIGLSVNGENVYHGFCSIDNARNKVRMYSDDCSDGFYDKTIATIKKDASGRIVTLSVGGDEIVYNITYNAKGKIVETLVFVKSESGTSAIDRKLTYNEQGLVQSEIIVLDPESSNTTLANNTYKYEYDESHNWNIRKCYNADGEEIAVTRRTFERPEHMMNHIYND